MTCIIIDDEPLAREELKILINEVSRITIAGMFSNAPAAAEFITKNKVDLIFLDIEMPNVTGLQFAANLSEETLVIFTTAYPQYALKSYELDAIDYLLKPIDKEKLAKAINKAIVFSNLLSEKTEKAVLESNTEDFLLVKSDRRFYKVNFSDIKYIEGLKDYVIIYMGGQRLITAMNLKTIHKKIPASLFLRVSKSYLVNMSYVNSFDHHTIYIDDVEIPIGDVYKEAFFRIYTGDSFNPRQ